MEYISVLVIVCVLLIALVVVDLQRGSRKAEYAHTYRVSMRKASVHGDMLTVCDELYGKLLYIEYGDYVFAVQPEHVWLADQYVQNGMVAEA